MTSSVTTSSAVTSSLRGESAPPAGSDVRADDRRSPKLELALPPLYVASSEPLVRTTGRRAAAREGSDVVSGSRLGRRDSGLGGSVGRDICGHDRALCA